MLGVLRLLGRFARDRRGNVAVMAAILIVPLIGLLGLAGEISTWYTIDRSLQNATDAAAIAAARNNDQTNDPGGMLRYQREAFAVASQYGLVNGVNNVTLSAAVVACPSGSGTCYQVWASRPVPVLLSAITGFLGNTTLNGGNGQLIGASSIATTVGGATRFCLLTLSDGITKQLVVDGGPNTDMGGCSTASNGAAICNGGGLGNSGYSYAAAGDKNDCGDTAAQDKTNAGNLVDPFAGLASQIPPNTCPSPTSASSYPQEPKKGFPTGSPNLISGSRSGTQVVCGDQQLSGDLTLPAGTLFVIENGALDLNGFTVNATNATIIFTGPTIAGLTPSHFPVGSGTLNLTAPVDGTWQDVAMYQDPALPAGAGVDITSAGNTPTWNINGVVDVPNSNVTVSGDINRGVSDCFGLVSLTLTFNGTGFIANETNNCNILTIPGTGNGTNVALVQ
jgi:Flp pilus assembly protein TadG